MTVEEEVARLIAALRQAAATWFNNQEIRQLERLIEITEKLLKEKSK